MIIHRQRKKKVGRGLLNKIINKLPFELHLPGYQYCGPGTKLTKRLARGDPGVNPLDAACKQHDIAYSENREDISGRNAADRILAERAWERVRSKDAGLGEKAAAWAVTNAMKLKSTFGMGLRRKASRKKTKSSKKKSKVQRAPTTLNSIIKAASKSIKPNKSAAEVINSALKSARAAMKKAGGKKCVKVPRILPVSSKIGGVLPLIPIFAGLSATGALASGASGIMKAINGAKAAKRQLEESQRHNKTMEAIALGKGLYLKPHKKGYGLYLRPYSGRGLKKKDRCRFTKKSTI